MNGRHSALHVGQPLDEELLAAGADWQFVQFSKSVHCFAEPDETTPGGCLFHEPSYRRSMLMMRNFFAEVFAKK